MIEQIRIENFKSLKHVDLKLGRLNLFIGANGSGKSNLLEAFRVVQGVALGLSADAILNETPTMGERGWKGIRGGSAHAVYASSDNGVASKGEFSISGMHSGPNVVQGAFKFNLDTKVLKGNSWWGNPLNDNTVEPFHQFNRDLQEKYRKGECSIEEMLEQIQKMISERNFLVAQQVSEMQFFDPKPNVLRAYSDARQVTRMGEAGEFFPLIIEALQSEGGKKEEYLNWLRELTPERIEDVAVLSGEDESERRFAVVEDGRKVSARILSDGTLRFAALLAAFYQPHPPEVLLLEDVETGLHPARLRLLMEMFSRLGAATGIQIIATTHSPLVVDWAAAFEGTQVFVCLHTKEEGTQIIPVEGNEHWKTMKEEGLLGEFFGEGGMEIP